MKQDYSKNNYNSKIDYLLIAVEVITLSIFGTLFVLIAHACML